MGGIVDADLFFLKFLVKFRLTFESFPVASQQAFRMVPFVTDLLADLLHIARRRDYSVDQFKDLAIHSCFPVALSHQMVSRYYYRPQVLMNPCLIMSPTLDFTLNFTVQELVANILRGLNHGTRSCFSANPFSQFISGFVSVYARIIEIQFLERERSNSQRFRSRLAPTSLRRWVSNKSSLHWESAFVPKLLVM